MTTRRSRPPCGADCAVQGAMRFRLKSPAPSIFFPLPHDLMREVGNASRCRCGRCDMDEVPFWRRKGLADMTSTEWESLCDGCGRCCLNKLEDEDTGRVYYTDVGCRLLDGTTCRCKDYDNRSEAVDDCVRLSPDNVAELDWLPQSCAYRLVANGRDLYWWHPLVSGDP